MAIPLIEKITESEILDPLSHLPDGALEDPYPLLAKMREVSAIQWSSKSNQWLVVRYDEASMIMRSNKFGKRLDQWRHPKFVMRQTMKVFRRGGSNSILLQDPPDHTRVRALVNSAFTPRVVHDLEEHIASIASGLIERLVSGNEVDLISNFAFPLPVTVIAELLGVLVEDREKFKEWSSKITLGLDVSRCPMRLVHSFFAMDQLRRYLSKIIDGKRKSPGNDLISSLIAAQLEDNHQLSREELLANSVLILIAGHETTSNLIGNGVYTLLNHPEQKRLFIERPHIASNAVDEILRYDPPVQLVRRVVREGVEIAGAKLRENDGITILFGACNRDPRVFTEPDKFDILRQNIRHLTFGAGIHFCLGAELARTEARIALSLLFKRFPNLALANEPITYKGPFGLRGPQRLMVVAG